MPEISFRGKITDFHPTNKSTVKITIEMNLDEENAKLLWVLDKGLDITIADNQTTLTKQGGG